MGEFERNSEGESGQQGQSVKVIVTGRVSAPMDRVFEAWLEPRMLERWMFGPTVREEEIVSLNNNAAVGGHFAYVVRRNGVEITHVGEYLELDRPRRLVFTWGVAATTTDSSQVTVELSQHERFTELTLTHELHPAWRNFAPQTEAGWRKMIEALAKAL